MGPNGRAQDRERAAAEAAAKAKRAEAEDQVVELTKDLLTIASLGGGHKLTDVRRAHGQ